MVYLVELLAPAGNLEAFTAALESGADAIYLAGAQFGARHYATNFSSEELATAIRSAHLRGTKVFITVNTLVDNSELPALVDYLRYLYDIGADAIIVQDVGVAALAAKVVPAMPIHASTQMTVHNLAGVEFLANLGFKRAVLARELSLEEIGHICQTATIEIEIFIHGALCISYSGQCLMSSMIGGRSGNRGRCAQPCRLPYTLVDSQGQDELAGEDVGEYLLSPKDLCGIELIPQLLAAGVTSFKIEGRMKRAEYVAVVVDTYRRAIDRVEIGDGFSVPSEDVKNMAQVFNRGFTDAYLMGKKGKQMISDRRPNNRGVRLGRVLSFDGQSKLAEIKLDEALAVGDMIEFWVKVGGRTGAPIPFLLMEGQKVDAAPAGAIVKVPVDKPVKVGDRAFKTFDRPLMDKAKRFFASPTPLRRILIDAQVSAAEGQPLVITLRDEAGNSGQGATAFLAEKARSRPLDESVVAKQVGRLGTTIFALRNLTISLTDELMVPVSEINEARRKAVEELETARLKPYIRPSLSKKDDKVISWPVRPVAVGLKPELAVQVDTVEKVVAALAAGADVIMFGGEHYGHQQITADTYRQVVALVHHQGKKVVLSTPRIVKDIQLPGFQGELDLFRQLSPDGISVANIGVLQMIKAQGITPIQGDYPLNVYNSPAVDFFAAQGVGLITLSPELNFAQIEQIVKQSPLPLECLVHGQLPLMIAEHCIPGAFCGPSREDGCNQGCNQGDHWLKDRKSEGFPIITDQFCRMHLLNAKELSMVPHISRFWEIGIRRLRIEGKAAPVAHLAQVTKLYRQVLDHGEKALPTGSELAVVEHGDITRGHYFRGVL